MLHLGLFEEGEMLHLGLFLESEMLHLGLFYYDSISRALLLLCSSSTRSVSRSPCLLSTSLAIMSSVCIMLVVRDCATTCSQYQYIRIRHVCNL
jgi:hypothetical protein